MNNLYPSVIEGFNVYKDGSKFIGISDKVALPDFTNTVSSIVGAGILGKFDAPVPGNFDNLDQEIPFRTLADGIFTMLDPTQGVDLTLRGAIQKIEMSTGATKHVGMRVVFRGLTKGFKPGTVESGNSMDSSITLSLLYILIEIDGKTMLELDKLNGVYKVNGNDIMAQIKSLC